MRTYKRMRTYERRTLWQKTTENLSEDHLNNLHRILYRLSAKQQKIINDSKTMLTLKEVGDANSLSQERVRQIIAMTIRRSRVLHEDGLKGGGVFNTLPRRTKNVLINLGVVNDEVIEYLMIAKGAKWFLSQDHFGTQVWNSLVDAYGVGSYDPVL